MAEVGGSFPALIAARVEAQAEAVRTPCGEGTMVWRRWGSGEPLVLIHGGTGSWRHWIRNIEHFARTRTVWVPDLPGMGDSSDPPHGTHMAEYGAIVHAGLISLLDPTEQVDLVGFSFGGLNAGIVANLLGERARRLIVTGTAGLAMSNAPRERMIVWRKISDPVKFVEAQRNNLEVLMFGDPANLDALAVYLQVENARRARLRRAPMGGYYLLRESLPHIKARVHAIWGSRDISALPELEQRAELVRRSHPGAEVSILEGMGHWVMYEGSAAYNALLDDILSRARS